MYINFQQKRVSRLNHNRAHNLFAKSHKFHLDFREIIPFGQATFMPNLKTIDILNIKLP